MTAPELELLESVLAETEATIAAVRPDQGHLPTPCPELEVTRLVDHLVGWATSFATRLNHRSLTGDNPNDHRAGENPAEEFHQAAQAMVGAYGQGREQARMMPVGFLIMEFLVHGWDLATATGQPVSFKPAAADLGLATGRKLLQPEYRGPGKTFGYEVEVSDAAGSVDRLVAFLGRDPGWQAPS